MILMLRKKYIFLLLLLLTSGVLFPFSRLYAQNAPVSTIGMVNSYSNSATVQVTAINILNIGSFSIKILYDSTVVHPTGATVGPQLGGNMSVNLNLPGIIYLSWYTYPGVTITGNPVILNLNFTKVANGTSALSWSDNGVSCAWYDGNGAMLNDAPTSSYYIAGSLSFSSPNAPHTFLSTLNVCQGTTVSMPVKVSAFSNIGSLTLTLNYTQAALVYLSFTNTSGFPGLSVNAGQPGTLVISGSVSTGGNGITLADSSVLVTLNFNSLAGPGTLAWTDNGTSCQYAGPPPVSYILNDVPQNTYYLNGTVSGTTIPGASGVIIGPVGGNVCPGQTGVNFSIPAVPNATVYVWSLPPGAQVTGGAQTNNISVTFGSLPGNWDINVYANNVCGNGQASPVFTVYVNEPPTITAQPVSPDTVLAGAGSASFHTGASGSLLTYQWQESAGGWHDILNAGVYGGTSTSTLTITNPPVAMNGNQYRCIVGGLCPPQVVSDGNARLYVTDITGTGDNDPGKNGNKQNLSMDVFPNPVVSEFNIRYFLPETGHAVLEISDLCGRRMEVLSIGDETAGTHLTAKKVDMHPGLYLLTLTLQNIKGTTAITKKIMLQQ